MLQVPDGLSEIEHELPLVMEMIARTARWVHPDTFNALPVWCRDTARGRPRYDATWSRELISGRGVRKLEENIRAAIALMEALGVKGKPKNWTVCHIWGYDDENFAGKSHVVQDQRFYSCIGNMIWLPTPLKGFTDAVPQIKECLRVCAFQLYGRACEHEDVRTVAERVRSGAIPKVIRTIGRQRTGASYHLGLPHVPTASRLRSRSARRSFASSSQTQPSSITATTSYARC